MGRKRTRYRRKWRSEKDAKSHKRLLKIYGHKKIRKRKVSKKSWEVSWKPKKKRAKKKR